MRTCRPSVWLTTMSSTAFGIRRSPSWGEAGTLTAGGGALDEPAGHRDIGGVVATAPLTLISHTPSLQRPRACLRFKARELHTTHSPYNPPRRTPTRATNP